MALIICDGEVILSFDEWQETFDEPRYAQFLFEQALKGRARLRVDTIGGRRWRWTLEREHADGRWIAESTIGHPIWRFWGEPSVVYLRNSFPQKI